jgi:Tol biopolymer transport system component
MARQPILAAVVLALAAVLVVSAAVFSGEAAGPAPAKDPGQGGLIVFSSNRSGSWHIWTVRPDGSDLKELTTPPADSSDVDPTWSPDGRAILFSSTRGGKTGVWRMEADGKKPEKISDGDQAEWSPDGRRIALRRGDVLLERDLASGKEMRLTPADFAHPSGPAWSPDSKTIAFASRGDGANALYLVPADGGGAPAKLFDKEPACEPHWSPDGKSIVYETETHIACIGADGKDNRLVTWFGGVQRYGRFSPDGKAIVFCQGASERGPWELYLVPAAAGGKAVRLTEEGSDMTPDWKQ